MICASSAGCPIAGSTIDDFEELRGIFFIGYVFGFWASILFSSHYQPGYNFFTISFYHHISCVLFSFEFIQAKDVCDGR